MPNKVTLSPSGRTFTVEDGESVLDAALRQGIQLPYGCRSGSCGSCMGRIDAGAVQYPDGRPPGLTAEDAQQGYALLCQARPAEDVTVAIREMAGGNLEVRTLPARVAEKTPLAHDVMRLRLKLPASRRLPFRAGQYVDILLGEGRRRSFSMANAPHEDERLELHIRRVTNGDFTTRVFEDLPEKAMLRLQGPLGGFYLREDSERPILMVAGGTGFAPMQAMLSDAFHRGLGRPIHLFWGVRARRDLYLPDVPARWAREQPGFRYTPVLSDPQPKDAWDGEKGWVHDAVLAAYPDLSGFDVYAAGPPPMVAAVRQAFPVHGLPEDRLFFDAFEFSVDPA